MNTSFLSHHMAVLPLASSAGARASVRNSRARSRHGGRPSALHSAAMRLAVLLALAAFAAPAFGQSAVDGFDPKVDLASFVSTIAVQADGKIIIGGAFETVGGTSRTNIARLNVDGSVDAGFTNGANRASGFVLSLVVQADGKILVGGLFTTLGGQSHTNVGRLNADGSVDATFTNGANSIVRTLAVQADGKILIGGDFTTLGGQPRTQIGRLNADGSVDATFTNGVAGYVSTLVVQADGKILLGGQFTTVGGQSRTNLGRLNADGSVDATFTNGANGRVNALAVQADGMILVGGDFATLGGQSRAHIGRLNADGSVDTSFNPGPNSSVHSLAVQADGKILVGGRFITLAGQSRWSLGRLNPDGNFDASFSFDAQTEAGDNAYSVVVQADGKILIGGGFFALRDRTDHYCIARFHADGSLDTTLNPDPNQSVSSLAVQPDEKILLAGNFETLGEINRPYMARMHASGRVDTAFGIVGSDNQITCMALQPDGQIVVGGIFQTLGGTNRSRIARLNADGSLDPAFNPGINRPGPGPSVRCLALQTDGKILVGGNFNTLGGTNRDYIGRLHPNGSVDAGFTNGANSVVSCLAVQADGKILVGGSFTTLGGQPRAYMGRFNSDGGVDATFTNGVAGPGGAGVSCLAVQADGKILVGGGFTTLGGQSRTNLGRLNADGSVDATFTNGANGGVNSLVLQTDGKILVAGSFTTLGGQSRSRIGRFNADGSVDATFDPGTTSSASSDPVRCLAVQVDGKILVGGFFTNLAGQSRTNLGRLTSGSGAREALAVNASGVTATWSRSGAGPEVQQVTFEQSSDGTNYSALGSATRISGGWRLSGLSLPMGQSFYLRARGRVTGGQNSGSSGLIESVRQFHIPGTTPMIAGARLMGSGHYQLSFPFAFGVNFTALATTDVGSPVTNWTALGPVTEFAPGQFQFTDSTVTNYPARFYQVRSP